MGWGATSCLLSGFPGNVVTRAHTSSCAQRMNKCHCLFDGLWWMFCLRPTNVAPLPSVIEAWPNDCLTCDAYESRTWERQLRISHRRLDSQATFELCWQECWASVCYSLVQTSSFMWLIKWHVLYSNEVAGRKAGFDRKLNKARETAKCSSFIDSQHRCDKQECICR